MSSPDSHCWPSCRMRVTARSSCRTGWSGRHNAAKLRTKVASFPARITTAVYLDACHRPRLSARRVNALVPRARRHANSKTSATTNSPRNTASSRPPMTLRPSPASMKASTARSSHPEPSITQCACWHRQKLARHRLPAASPARPTAARSARTDRCGARPSSVTTATMYSAQPRPVGGKVRSMTCRVRVFAGRAGGDHPNSARPPSPAMNHRFPSRRTGPPRRGRRASPGASRARALAPARTSKASSDLGYAEVGDGDAGLAGSPLTRTLSRSNPSRLMRSRSTSRLVPAWLIRD